MIKFIVVFINFIVIYNNIIIFYYNLCYLSGFLIIFIFIYKDIEWFNIIIRLGCNYYPIILVIKVLDWTLGLIFMCLNESSGIKLLIFINILVVLIIFFIFIDLILFYLLFEIRLFLLFF